MNEKLIRLDIPGNLVRNDVLEEDGWYSSEKKVALENNLNINDYHLYGSISGLRERGKAGIPDKIESLKDGYTIMLLKKQDGK